jgi:DNA-binding NtrC family response regulator
VSPADAGGACVRRRILVVDDDRRTVTTLCDLLHAHGWEAAAAYSAEEANAITREPFIAEIDSDPRKQAEHGDYPDR